MIGYLIYNLAILWTYFFSSTNICLYEEYNIFTRRCYEQLKSGFKHLCIQLFVMNCLTNYEYFTDKFDFYESLLYFTIYDFSYFVMNAYSYFINPLSGNPYTLPFSAPIMNASRFISLQMIPTFLPLMCCNVNLVTFLVINYLFFVHKLYIHSSYRLPYEPILLGSQYHMSHRITKRYNFGLMLPIWDEIFRLNTCYIPLSRIRHRIRRRHDNDAQYRRTP